MYVWYGQNYVFVCVMRTVWIFICLCVVDKFYFLSLCERHFLELHILAVGTRLDYFQVVFKTMLHSLSILQCRKITIVGIIGKNAYYYCIFAAWGLVYIVKPLSLSPISYISSIHTKLKNFKKSPKLVRH